MFECVCVCVCLRVRVRVYCAPVYMHSLQACVRLSVCVYYECISERISEYVSACAFLRACVGEMNKHNYLQLAHYTKAY